MGVDSKLKPIVFVSSFPPRKCGIATFTEEAIEFIKKHQPNRPIHVISHTDGKGKNVHPIIAIEDKNWYRKVYEKILELDPYVVHFEHEYALYMYFDPKGMGDDNEGFLRLLGLLREKYPTIVELHTIHGRLRASEEHFVRECAFRATALIFKCEFQRWRLGWTFSGAKWQIPHNIFIIPHGARPDKLDFNKNAKKALGLKQLNGKKVLGILGWVQPNKRWDIIYEIWEDLRKKIQEKTKEKWILFCAGTTRVKEHKSIYREYRKEILTMQKKGSALFYDFLPRGDPYYQAMAVCDVVSLPSLDETQSGTLARIIALGKPYFTTAPMEGLTSQTVASEGGLMFCDMPTLKRAIFRLCTDKKLRERLSKNQVKYLENVVSWDRVAKQYIKVYENSRDSFDSGKKIFIPDDF